MQARIAMISGATCTFSEIRKCAKMWGFSGGARKTLTVVASNFGCIENSASSVESAGFRDREVSFGELETRFARLS